MRLFEVFNIVSENKDQRLLALKDELVNRLKDLPDDQKTLSALQEIEELLNSVHAGGRVEYVNHQLKNLNDPDVAEARRVLARYILSLGADPEDRQKMLETWKEDDGLVDTKILLTPGKVNFMPDVIRGYDNPAIKEFADEIFEIEGYGKGKGEFALSIMSRSINLPAKGDLFVIGFGNVEIKAESKQGGRFYDQEVTPSPNYRAVSKQIDDLLSEKIGFVGTEKTGISLAALCVAVSSLQQDEDFDTLKSLIKELVESIFYSLPATQTNSLADFIVAGDSSSARQLYTELAFDNYRKKKTEDKGILFLQLNVDPYKFVYATDLADVKKAGMKLTGSTIYPIVRITDMRPLFPQTTVRLD